MKIIFLQLCMFLGFVISFQVSAKDWIELSRICETSANNQKIIVKYFSWYTVDGAWNDIVVEHSSGLNTNHYYFSGMYDCNSEKGTQCSYKKCSMEGTNNSIAVYAIHKPSFGQKEPKFDNFLLDLAMKHNNEFVIDATGIKCRKATSLENDEEMSRVGAGAFPYTCAIVNGKEYSTTHE